MDNTMTESINALIAKINGKDWKAPSDWTSVPAAFSTAGRGKKYWKSYSREENTLYFFGPLDFNTFFLPDTVVHQTLQLKHPVKRCIAFMEIPEEKLKRRNISPPDAYLSRFQGIYWGVFSIAILPCKGLAGNVENLNRMKILFNRFSPTRLQGAQEHHELLARLVQETRVVVAEAVEKQIQGGVSFKKERDVSVTLDPVVQSFFKGKGFRPTATKFKGLWRNPNSDHAFVKAGNGWPGKLFVELKCDVDIKAPLVQVSENLAADSSAAVLQIRVPSKPTKEPDLVSLAKKRMAESLPVRYIEIQGW